jgi:dihydropyrimidine dehydrogenase (NAD+) subunit PreA
MRYGYDIVEELIEGLSFYLEDKGMASPSELVARGLENLVGHEALSREYKAIASVDENLCVGCGACVIACRDGGHQAIAFADERKGGETERVPVVDKEKCIGCGFCPTVCPVVRCISMKERLPEVEGQS